MLQLSVVSSRPGGSLHRFSKRAAELGLRWGGQTLAIAERKFVMAITPACDSRC